jgi:hypothetical protein
MFDEALSSASGGTLETVYNSINERNKGGKTRSSLGFDPL